MLRLGLDGIRSLLMRATGIKAPRRKTRKLKKLPLRVEEFISELVRDSGCPLESQTDTIYLILKTLFPWNMVSGKYSNGMAFQRNLNVLKQLA